MPIPTTPVFKIIEESIAKALEVRKKTITALTRRKYVNGIMRIFATLVEKLRLTSVTKGYTAAGQVYNDPRGMLALCTDTATVNEHCDAMLESLRRAGECFRLLGELTEDAMDTLQVPQTTHYAKPKDQLPLGQQRTVILTHVAIEAKRARLVLNGVPMEEL